jgi:hypothetical protein
VVGERRAVAFLGHHAVVRHALTRFESEWLERACGAGVDAQAAVLGARRLDGRLVVLQLSIRGEGQHDDERTGILRIGEVVPAEGNRAGARGGHALGDVEVGTEHDLETFGFEELSEELSPRAMDAVPRCVVAARLVQAAEPAHEFGREALAGVVVDGGDDGFRLGHDVRGSGALEHLEPAVDDPPVRLMPLGQFLGDQRERLGGGDADPAVAEVEREILNLTS